MNEMAKTMTLQAVAALKAVGELSDDEIVEQISSWAKEWLKQT